MSEHHNYCDAPTGPCLLAARIAELEAENARMREALEEMTKPPYRDSDLHSLIDWVNARARAALSEGK